MNELKSFGEHLNKYRGEKGTKSRVKFDTDSLAFRLGVMLKEARKEANLTQEELAQRAGIDKSYISDIENGRSDVSLSDFHTLIELDLKKALSISIN